MSDLPLKENRLESSGPLRARNGLAEKSSLLGTGRDSRVEDEASAGAGCGSTTQLWRCCSGCVALGFCERCCLALVCARRSTECTLPELALAAFVLVLVLELFATVLVLPPPLLLEAPVDMAVVAVVAAKMVVGALVVVAVAVGVSARGAEAADVEDAGCALVDLREESEAVVAPAATASGGRPFAFAAALACCRGSTDTTIGSTDLPLDVESDSIGMGAALVGAVAVYLHKTQDQ